MPLNPDLIDIDKAAHQLDVSRPTLYRWLRNGHIKGVKMGRQWRVAQDELDRFRSGDPAAAESPAGTTSLIDSLTEQLHELGVTVDDDPATPASVASHLVRLAAALRAAEIHIEPRVGDNGEPNKKSGLARFRIDGVMGCPVPFDLRTMPAIIDQLKSWVNCNVNEKHQPQDGRARLKIAKRDFDLRVSFLPTPLGESATIILLDSSGVLVSLEKFDFTDSQLKQVKRSIESPSGLVLVVGPSGSGKTTTLYGCLQHIATPQRRVITIEDPVEYILPGMTQVAVNPQKGVSFAAAARSAQRSQPDAMMVAELKDREIAEICCVVAATGTLVLSSMHTQDGATALSRLVRMGIEPGMACDTVRMVIAQRLVRSLCPKCAQPVDLTDAQLDDAKTLAEKGNLEWDDLPQQFHKPVGCAACGDTGYRGRRAVLELFESTPATRAAITQNASATDLRNAALADGMTSMPADAIRRAANGQTSIEEVTRLAAGLEY